MIDSPIIFKEGKYSKKDIDKFINSNNILEKIDLYALQINELFKIKNPKLLFDKDFEKERQNFATKKLRDKNNGDYIFYPWNKKFIHSVSEEEYFLLRTNRNRELITLSEQKKLYNSCIAIAGLSIGSSFATALSYQGIANNLTLADFDTLDTTNLNRIRANLTDVGREKIKILAEQIYAIDPYANLRFFENGIDDSLIDSFISTPRPKIIFDAIDDLKMKIKLRLKAREKGICVLMVTNLGDSALIDVERYDLSPNIKLFNGRIGDFPEKILKDKITKQEENKYVLGIVGKENIPQKALTSVSNIGKTLVGRPQLATTVFTTGAIAAIISRKIILGEKVNSGRKLVSFDEVFIP